MSFAGDVMPKILLAGQDVRLLETRAAVLRKTGAEVVYCEGSQVCNIVVSEMPDLVVLCHSLLEVEAEAIADQVHECCPKARVLLVVSQMADERQNGDAKFDATSLSEPRRLVVRVTELLRGLPYQQVREITHDSQRPLASQPAQGYEA
jgi:response regulator RpfG family c-di-GMP phosphodiesterase